MLKHTFIYAHMESMVFPAPTFIKLKSGQQHYVQILYTKFHPSGTIYMWKLQTNLFPDLKYGFHYVNFHETQIAQWHHVGPFIPNFTQVS